MEASQPGFIDFFKEVPDHRIERRKLYSVEEILLLSFCGMIAGCDSWNDLELLLTHTTDVDNWPVDAEGVQGSES